MSKERTLYELEQAGRILRDPAPMPLKLSPQDVCLTLSGIQLAYRNQALSEETRMLFRKLGEKIELALTPIDPNVKHLFAPAWLGQSMADMGSLLNIMRHPQDVILEFSVGNVWLLISAFQLCIRHPMLPPSTNRVYQQMGRQMQSAIVGNFYPEAAAIIEHGWNPDYDEPLESEIAEPAPSDPDPESEN